MSAAIEAAKKGMHVVVYDENAKPGGQLFKQIHKFFGSKGTQGEEVRGYRDRCSSCLAGGSGCSGG